MQQIKPFKIACFTILSLLCGDQLFSQENMTLQGLINKALDENYQIQIYRNLTEAASNSNTVGNAGILPIVDLTGEARNEINNSRQEFLSGETQNANNAQNTSLSGSIGARWIVFDGLAMFARKKQLEELELLSQADKRFYIEQTVADISVIYYQLLQENQLLNAYQKSLEVSQTRVKFERRAVDVGSSDMLDLQLALVDRNTDSSMVLQQEARIQELSISLNRIINQKLTTSINPADSIQLKSDMSLVNLIKEAKENNAQLNQQQLNELIALSETKIRKGELFPEIELFGNYSYNRQQNEVGFLSSRRSYGPDFGIRVRFNLFSGGQRQIARENASIALENEEILYEDLSQEVEASIRTAYIRWSNSLKQISLEQESVSAALQALEIAAKQYEIGEITNIDFRLIQLNAINARTRLLEAQYLAKSREIEMLRMSGRLLQDL